MEAPGFSLILHTRSVGWTLDMFNSTCQGQQSHMEESVLRVRGHSPSIVYHSATQGCPVTGRTQIWSVHMKHYETLLHDGGKGTITMLRVVIALRVVLPVSNHMSNVSVENRQE